MSEIKLNEWRWGVVPELHSEAVVMLGGMADKPQDCPQHCKRKCVNDEEDEDWTEYSHLVGMIEHKYRYVVGDFYDCAPTTYQFCEVQD